MDDHSFKVCKFYHFHLYHKFHLCHYFHLLHFSQAFHYFRLLEYTRVPVALISRLPFYVFCICLSTVELADQLSGTGPYGTLINRHLVTIAVDDNLHLIVLFLALSKSGHIETLYSAASNHNSTWLLSTVQKNPEQIVTQHINKSAKCYFHYCSRKPPTARSCLGALLTSCSTMFHFWVWPWILLFKGISSYAL